MNNKMENHIEHWQNSLLSVSKRNNYNIHVPYPADTNHKKFKTLFIWKPSYEILLNHLKNASIKLKFDVVEHDSLDKNNDKKNIEKNTKEVVIKIETDKSQDDAIKTLENLKKMSQLSLEERGFNTLYLAIGVLHWFENEKSDNPTQSPLLFIPVTLTRENLYSDFILKKLENDIEYNHSLALRLKKDFDIEFPKYANDIDEKNVININNIDKYFDDVKKIINSFSEEQKWFITTDVLFSIFTFDKINMYEDLRDNSEKIKNHPIIQRILKVETTELSNNSMEFDLDHDKKELKSMNKESYFSYRSWCFF
jgi:hypothetical protein